MDTSKVLHFPIPSFISKTIKDMKIQLVLFLRYEESSPLLPEAFWQSFQYMAGLHP